jgi:hypothetical protein
MEWELDSRGKLLRQLREPVPSVGKPIAVPSLPTHYSARAEPLRTLRDPLRADLDRPVVITGAVPEWARMACGSVGNR